jgi:NAD(P)-dependent dehydrogenase (short-subunit alcohol dehydrogenase family)
MGVAAAGAKVIVTDVRLDSAQSTAEEIRSARGEASAYQLDVTDAAACTGLAERVGRDRRGEGRREQRRDHHPGTIDSARAHENWRQVLDVNVNGLFNVVHAWLAALRSTRGTIINVASIASFVGVGGTLGYAPSKGTVKLFTQALARDLAPDGIRVNAIAPGVIETPITARTPLGRVGQPEELVGPVILLASPRASYVNGVILPVDGGFSGGLRPPDVASAHLARSQQLTIRQRFRE